MSNTPSMQDLLEAGVHFGHQVRRWNPKMRNYIFDARDGVHVIDLEQTYKKLEDAMNFVRQLGEEGKIIIFLGSKKQAKAIVEEEAKRCGAKYVTERWIGGLLTNWEQTSSGIKKLKELKEQREEGIKDRTKKEKGMIDREIAKLERFYGGIHDLEGLPDALFIVDVRKEENAAKEAGKKNIPVVAIADTNANLDLVDYPIPGNDDAIKAIRILCAAIADAYLEGRQIFEKKGVKLKAKEEKEAAKEEKAN